MEVFKEHYTGYLVSNFGRVKNKKGFIYSNVPRGGYERVRVKVGSKEVNLSVHKLVLETFIGPAPDGCEVDHINEVKNDNRLENLRYISKLENTRRSLYKRQNKYNCLPEKTKIFIVNSGLSKNLMARVFGVNWKTIDRLVRGDR